MILEKRLHLIPRKRQSHPEPIAVVVVRYVLAPVEERRRLLIRVCLAIVVYVNGAGAATSSERRRNQHNDFLSNRIDKRRALAREPISKFHQHLARTLFR